MKRAAAAGAIDEALIAVFTTIDDAEAARRMARTLVERRLAACAQISQIESVYAWQGAIASEVEFRLLLKTRAALYPELEAAIRELHHYQLPAIHALPVVEAEPAYAQWVRANSGAVGGA